MSRVVLEYLPYKTKPDPKLHLYTDAKTSCSRNIYMPMFVLRFCFVVFLLPLLFGCAAIALTGAGVGTSYTLSNVAYRSFSFSVDRVHHATIAALNKMDIQIIDDSKSQDGRTITAATKELDVVIYIEEVTSKTTQLKVDARKKFLLKDKATAAEIINQVGIILGG